MRLSDTGPGQIRPHTLGADDAAEETQRHIPRSGIGMHLYTMRRSLGVDTPGTYQALSDIGYTTVGVSGRHGHSARELRSIADDVGLEIVLEHVGYDRLHNDWDGALEDVRGLGAQWVVIPSLPGALHSPDGYRQVADEFNSAGALARQAGLTLLFHNHGHDFDTVDGEILYDILLAETDPELVGFLLDLYWCVDGGYDPADYFAHHPGRFPSLHVKDMSPSGDFADVGSGVLDFLSMFDLARPAGVKQWLVEHDNPSDEMVTAQNSYDYLVNLRY
ncbi:MAG: sugar phosphate isomerase/epimerase family protein [Nocardioidaceae bacterium]